MNRKIKRLPFLENIKDTYKTIFYLICTLVIVIISFIFTNGDVRKGMVIGGILGLIVSWRITMIAKMEVHNTVKFMSELHQKLERFGYLMIDRNHYVIRSKRLLRFDSQNVLIDYVSGNNEKICIIGPYYILRLLLKNNYI